MLDTPLLNSVVGLMGCPEELIALLMALNLRCLPEISVAAGSAVVISWIGVVTGVGVGGAVGATVATTGVDVGTIYTLGIDPGVSVIATVGAGGSGARTGISEGQIKLKTPNTVAMTVVARKRDRSRFEACAASRRVA